MFVEQCCDKGGATLVGSVDASLSPGADRDGLRHVGAAFGLVGSPAWALCLAVCAFRAILGAQAGQCVPGASACSHAGGHSMKHIGGAGFVWPIWLEEACAT